MAKTILTFEFDSENYSDKQEINRILKSEDMACVLFEITNNLKKKCKNLVDTKEENAYSSSEVVELVFEKIYELLDALSINIDELIS